MITTPLPDQGTKIQWNHQYINKSSIRVCLTTKTNLKNLWRPLEALLKSTVKIKWVPITSKFAFTLGKDWTLKVFSKMGICMVVSSLEWYYSLLLLRGNEMKPSVDLEATKCSHQNSATLNAHWCRVMNTENLDWLLNTPDSPVSECRVSFAYLKYPQACMLRFLTSKDNEQGH